MKIILITPSMNHDIHKYNLPVEIPCGKLHYDIITTDNTCLKLYYCDSGCRNETYDTVYLIAGRGPERSVDIIFLPFELTDTTTTMASSGYTSFDLLIGSDDIYNYQINIT